MADSSLPLLLLLLLLLLFPTIAYAIYAFAIKLQHAVRQKTLWRAGREAGRRNWELARQTKGYPKPVACSQSGREIILAERCHLLGKFFAFCGIALKKNYALCGTGERENNGSFSAISSVSSARFLTLSFSFSLFPCPLCSLVHLPVDRPAGPLFPARNQQLSKLTAQPDWTEPRPHESQSRSCPHPTLS